MPVENTGIREGRCDECGADPLSPVALEVKAEVEERSSSSPSVICPNCGSTQGFRPYPPHESDSRPDPPVLLFGCLVYLFLLPYVLFRMLGAGANLGELQCFKCQYIFRPQSRVRDIGCIVLLLLGLAVIIGVMIYRAMLSPQS